MMKLILRISSILLICQLNGFASIDFRKPEFRACIDAFSPQFIRFSGVQSALADRVVSMRYLKSLIGFLSIEYDNRALTMFPVQVHNRMRAEHYSNCDRFFRGIAGVNPRLQNLLP